MAPRNKRESLMNANSALLRKSETEAQPPPTPRETAVRVSGLDYKIGGRSGTGLQILSGIDLDVAADEFIALVGTSGCGKSTLLNMIAGLTAPSGGEILVHGKPVTGISKRVGYMFQTDSLLPWRSVIENVEVGLEMAGVGKAERRQAALKQLAEVGLAGFENHWPSELSGGMRQRASLARTWLTNPDILLMDEPFGALDSQTKLIIQEAFVSVWESHKQTVILVTHDLEEAIALADRVIVMSARPGRIKSEYRIDLPRPRSLVELRSDARFHAYWKSIWSDLEEGARRSLSPDPLS